MASFSPPLRAERRESISSTKIIDGARAFDNANNARTNFSLSPSCWNGQHHTASPDASSLPTSLAGNKGVIKGLTYLLVSELALILKKVLLDSVATALANIVFPVPGGPNNNIPCAGSLSPENRSGLRNGYTTASFNACLAPSKPATSLQ